jgi:hypothetical protein
MAARCSFLSTPVAFPSVPSGIALGPQIVSFPHSGVYWSLIVEPCHTTVIFPPSYTELTSTDDHPRH